ncbi:hypothetical protein SDRG_04796 [Saprolegnia diclina VS20]|uniref:Uncharacterized protein n=1 Tax=Saprolegnia diclina (strain VS20) TaxID=1156394 RepID=T0QIC9_SAPDV|nr:hypothetical protein SDRG_04796 [Saprolegnia diclina VS20]EQC37769.1 hypothetical protein SDRG_04796 [Saprolegnia diclina VS20]|eukprot:XP_008608702.1 hypothetical protein SDRG_04796 [Saprolegnia diclina VS20]
MLATDVATTDAAPPSPPRQRRMSMGVNLHGPSQPMTRVLSMMTMRSVAVLHGLQGVFGTKSTEASSQAVVPKETTSGRPSKVEHDLHLRRMQAIWQLFVQGFELIKYPNKGRPRKRIIWLTLDGKLCVGKAKCEKDAKKFVFLWDIEHFSKGCNAPQFAESGSWRESKGREMLCFSIDARPHGGKVHSFALQVASNTVRNLLCENGSQLVQALRGDADGEYPKAARIKIAKHYACTGEVLALSEIRLVMMREGSELGTLLDEKDVEIVNDDNADDSPSDDE